MPESAKLNTTSKAKKHPSWNTATTYPQVTAVGEGNYVKVKLDDKIGFELAKIIKLTKPPMMVAAQNKVTLLLDRFADFKEGKSVADDEPETETVKKYRMVEVKDPDTGEMVKKREYYDEEVPVDKPKKKKKKKAEKPEDYPDDTNGFIVVPFNRLVVPVK